VDNNPRYNDCLEDKREDYQNCSVLCCVLQLLYAHWCEQFLQVNYGSAYWFGFSFFLYVWFFAFSLNYGQFVCHRVSYFAFLYICFWFGRRYQHIWLPGKTCPQNDQLCVEQDVKLNSLTRNNRLYLTVSTVTWLKQWTVTSPGDMGYETYTRRFTRQWVESERASGQKWKQIKKMCYSRMLSHTSRSKPYAMLRTPTWA